VLAESIELLNEKQKASFLNEVSLMWKFVDEMGFTSILGFCSHPVSIIMKWYPKGSLDKWLMNGDNKVTLRIVTKYMVDISKALHELHLTAIVHGNVKSRAVLLDDEDGDSAVLTDFSKAQTLPDKISKDQLTRPLNYIYAAPELFSRHSQVSQDYVQAGDTFAFGVLIHECLTRSIPWGGVDESLSLRRRSEASTVITLGRRISKRY
jgi:serine/threonine protein kinase